MFVASSLYNYGQWQGGERERGRRGKEKSSMLTPDPPTPPATSSRDTQPTPDSKQPTSSSNTRVKRRPYNRNNARRGSSDPTSPDPSSDPPQPDLSSPPPSYASAVDAAKRAVVDGILNEQDLYKVLGVDRKAKADEIRRGFLARSRVCHPDKFPTYPPTTLAFQRVSFAYETLSKPTSRRVYDVSGRSDLASSVNAAGGADGGPGGAGMSDETLNSVLYSVFCEFMDGDFEMIRVLLSAMNEGSAGVQFGDDASENIEGVLHKLREMLLAGKRYFSIVRFELIRLYEIQHSLRQLSYFDVFGRLRLTLQLARVTLSIPMAIDQAMKEPREGEEEEEEDEDEGGDAGADSRSEEEEEEEEEDFEAPPPPPPQDEFGIAPEEEDVEAETDARTRRERKRAHRAQREERRRRRRHRKNVGAAPTEEPAQAPEEDAEGPLPSSTATGTGGAAGTGTGSTRRPSRRRRTASTVGRSGLLGPTTAGLLKGVVKVLETSEGWMPGRRTEGAP